MGKEEEVTVLSPKPIKMEIPEVIKTEVPVTKKEGMYKLNIYRDYFVINICFHIECRITGRYFS